MIPSNQSGHNARHYRDLKSQIDLRQVVEHSWGPGERAGRAVRYEARWREDGRKASFFVYEDGYKDFGGSGEQGDLFDWLQREGIASDLNSAFRWAQQYVGGTLHRYTPTTPPARHEVPQIASPDWQPAARKALGESQRYLWSERREARSVVAYLQQTRGLDEDTIRRWDLGYNPTWLKTGYLKSDGKRAYLPPGIVIPIRENGQLMALRVRCRVGNLARWLGIEPDQFSFGPQEGKELPKYMNLAGSRLSDVLFNADAVVAEQPMLLVEGEFDAMLADQMLNANRDEPIAVVTFGSASNTPSASSMTFLQQAREILLLPDQDPAGLAAARDLFNQFAGRATLIHLPKGKDTTDFVVEHAGDLNALIDAYADAQPCWWPSGTPDSWRSTLLSFMSPSTAPVVEMLNRAFQSGLVSMTQFDIPTLLEANQTLGYNIPERTLRQAVQQITGLFLQKVETDSVSIVSNSCRNSDKGRKAAVYQALGIDFIERELMDRVSKRLYEREHPVLEAPILAKPTATMLKLTKVSMPQAEILAKELDQKFRPAYRRQHHKELFAAERARNLAHTVADSLRDRWSTPLPVDWPTGNAKEYRAAFFHALAAATPDEPRSRRSIRDTFGVANGSVGSLVKRAGLEAEPQFQVIPLPTLENFQAVVKQQGYAVNGFPKQLIGHLPDGTTQAVPLRDQQVPMGFLTDLRKAGATVKVEYQTPNLYRVTHDLPPVIPPKKSVSGNGGYRHAVSRASRLTLPSYYGPDYNPAWVAKQFRYGLELLAWPVRDEKLIDPNTGEIVSPASIRELLELLLGRKLLEPEQEAAMWKRLELVKPIAG